jgi:hypothetical protein
MKKPKNAHDLPPSHQTTKKNQTRITSLKMFFHLLLFLAPLCLGGENGVRL